MRFAGDMFKAPMSESRRHYEGLIDKPVVPGFNTEDLVPTPELPAGTPFNQNDKGRYIQQQPGSGIAMSPMLLPAHVIRGAVQGQPTGDGTLPELKGQPDPFQQRNKIRPSDSDDQLMDIMRSGFV